MAINKCSRDNWWSKIYNFVQFGMKTVNFIVKRKIIFVARKDKINKFDQRGVGYKILCLDCTGVYIGETGRSFKTRRKEHQRDVKPDTIALLTNEDIKKKCALMKHVCLNGH